MTAAEVFRMVGVRLSPKEWRAVRYLERAGQRVCVDFGYANAIDKAREHWRQRRKRSR